MQVQSGYEEVEPLMGLVRDEMKRTAKRSKQHTRDSAMLPKSTSQEREYFMKRSSSHDQSSQVHREPLPKRISGTLPNRQVSDIKRTRTVSTSPLMFRQVSSEGTRKSRHDSGGDSPTREKQEKLYPNQTTNTREPYNRSRPLSQNEIKSDRNRDATSQRQAPSQNENIMGPLRVDNQDPENPHRGYIRVPRLEPQEHRLNLDMYSMEKEPEDKDPLVKVEERRRQKKEAAKEKEGDADAKGNNRKKALGVINVRPQETKDKGEI